MLLDKLREGRITPQERNELYLLSKDDAFISDALEGLDGISQDQLRSIVSALEGKIRQGTHSKDRRWLWGSAAAVILIAGTTAILMQDSPVQQDLVVMQDERPPEDAPAALNDAISDAPKAEVTQPTSSELKTGSDQPEGDTRTNLVQPEVEESPIQESSSMLDEASTYSMRRSTAERTIQNQDTMKNMGPGGAQGYALAAPIDGWEAYYTFVRNNIVVPREALEAGLEGSVYLEFDLDTDGRPTEIRVTQSLSAACDAEAIRLLRQGPLWDVQNAQVPIGRLKVDF